MKLRDSKERKSGSALLVVLGFLSFMVISAVAFAIYMRTERVPSSALRRNTATRHLVKAALAHAMSRVDDAIRNDPFPGLVNTNDNNIQNFYHDKDGNSMDLWLGRVFMPPNPEGLLDDNGSRVGMANEPGDGNKFPWRFAPVTETVSVLNLEALGYLPPPLVNDVRFLSRSSWAAKWQNFAFDAGRFAFCAVNVSDYFDINRTKVGVRSSPLDSCISLRGTLAYRPDGNEENVSEATFTSLSKMLGPEAVRQNYTNPDNDAGQAAGADTEYVSMLDYNLAFGANSGGISILSPLFYDWIYNNSGSRKYFYGGTTKTSEGAMQAMRQPFVTDSYSGGRGAVTNGVINFATLKGQVFPDYPNGMEGGLPAEQVLKGTTSDFFKRMFQHNLIDPNTDVLYLYDYLDHDDIPTSLAMPSVECVPMVTAVELAQSSTFCSPKLTAGGQTYDPFPPAAVPAKWGGKLTTTTTYNLDPSCFSALGVHVLVAFPFRHFSGRNTSGFNVQVVLKVFAAAVPPQNLVVRPKADPVSAGGVGTILANLHPAPNQNAWQNSTPFEIGGQANIVGYSFCSNLTPIQDTLFDDHADQKAALVNVPVTSWNGSPSQPAFFSVIEEQEYLNGQKSGLPKSSYQLNLRPFGNDGQPLSDQPQQGDVTTAQFANDQFRWYAMMWVRITDKSGTETYDLAPAVLADDALNPNGAQNATSPLVQQLLGLGQAPAGCLLFRGDASSSFKYADFTPQNLALLQVPGLNGTTHPQWNQGKPSLATFDPRYNYMPEHWFAWNGHIGPANWLDIIAKTGHFDVSDDRDPDIFMFTSNQGFLQSLGEFAFLPACRNFSFSTLQGTAWTDYATFNGTDILDQNGNKYKHPCAWKTRVVDRQFYDACANAGIMRSLTPAVNPFSDNGHILLSVFANTPCDYWTTGRTMARNMKNDDPNEPQGAGLREIWKKLGDEDNVSGEIEGPANDPKAVLKYAFGKDNKDESSRMGTAEMCKIMEQFSLRMRENCFKGSWEAVYDSLFEEEIDNLDGGNDYTKTDTFAQTFLGVDLKGDCPLYSIDRKFLYSYWRECFANDQQLFLIFVRAESTALGGPGEGTPSQQGGRAVALVWREPTSYNGGSNPNSTYPDSLASQQQRQEFHVGRRPHRMRVLFYHQFD